MVERFIRNSDNQIKLTLTEDGQAIAGAWTGLEVHIGDVVLSRAVDGDGITLSAVTGILTINPGDLTTDEKAAVDGLTSGSYYPVRIVLTSSTQDDGVVFGGPGSTLIRFHISDKP